MQSVRRLGSKAGTTVGRAWHIELLVPTLVCLASVGCGGDFAQVTGVVTVGGEPLRGGDNVRAIVFFHPVSGKGAAATGLIDGNGEYRLSTGSQSGVLPGDYLVACTATELVPAKDPQGLPGGKRLTPARYANPSTSEIRFQVQKGRNEIDIELEPAP